MLRRLFTRKGFLGSFAGLFFAAEEAGADPMNVSISIPGDGSALKGVVPVTVEARPLRNLSRVSLKVDSILVGSDVSDPFIFSWNTTALPDGKHVLLAEAFYKQRVSEASLTVWVANTVTPPPPSGSVFDVPTSIDSTGATDVTAALQSWINSIPNGTIETPSVLRFNGGTYRIHTMLTVSGRSNLIFDSSAQSLGGNTTLKHTTPVTLSGGVYTGNDSLRLIRFVDCKNISVRYLTFLGASPMPASGDGFKPWEANVQHLHTLAVSRCENFSVQFVKIDGSGGGDAINWGNENSGFRSTGVIEDCDLRNAHRCTIALVGSGGLTIRRNVLARGGFWMIDLEPNTVESSNYNTIIEDNRWESQDGLLSRCAIGAFAGSKDGRGLCEGLVIRNNTFDNRAAEIRLNTDINGGYPYPQRIKNVTITGNSTTINGPQIECRQVDGLTVSGNSFGPISDPEIGIWSCTGISVSGSTYQVYAQMPAPPLSNTLESGVNGNDVSTLDAGSPDSFNAISATPPKYTNVQKHSGSLSMRWVAQANVQHADFTGFGSLTSDVWCRAYLYLDDLPSDDNFYPLQFRTAADTSCAILRILSSGIIQGRTADNSNAFCEGTIAVATDQWVRLEWRVDPDTTAGTMEWRLYNNADSASASDSASSTGLVLGANIDRYNIGINTAAPVAGITVYYDDLAVSSTDWIGPSVRGRSYERLYGPAQLTGSAADLYTCPASTITRTLHIHASNPSGSPVDVNLSIGTDAAGTRVWDDLPIPADSVVDVFDPYELAAGETIQGWAATAGTVVVTITGYEDPV